MTTQDHGAGLDDLRFALADSFSHVVVGSGYYSQSIGFDAAREAADELLADDGPLSDLSVLVQIPEIHGLAVIARRACMVLGPEHVPAEHWETLADWIAALEATGGDA